jgi:hypothetical protein
MAHETGILAPCRASWRLIIGPVRDGARADCPSEVK